MLKGRPDWCLSRQRAWGVPIPAFTCDECDETYMSVDSVELFEKIVREEGVDIWFTKDVKELIPKNAKCPKCGSTKFSKENDILDVWFDSGASSMCVLNQRNLADAANVYLEGSDQYRGWFQSSLWPSLAIKDKAPYKEVITHGFMLDEKGKAMSKSQGNVIAPSKIIEKYGADILRLWVVSENYQDNIKLGDNLLQQVAEAYKKIRFTMRFLLSNLYDYDNTKNRVDYSEYDELAKYVTSRLSSVIKEAVENYNAYSFHNVFHKLHLFCVVDLSNNYLDIIKDIMYSDHKDSKRRRMHQSVLYDVLNALIKLLAPMLSFTCEEVYKTFFSEGKSVHLENFPSYSDYPRDEALDAKFKKIFEMKEDVYRGLEAAKNTGLLSNNLECKAHVAFKEKADDALLSAESLLKEYFVISGFEFSDKSDASYYEGEKYFVKIEKAEGAKCERCWIYYKSVGSHSDHPGLCTRCRDAVTKD
jgi:isoleucyl-tRNA synthetase